MYKLFSQIIDLIHWPNSSVPILALSTLLYSVPWWNLGKEPHPLPPLFCSAPPLFNHGLTTLDVWSIAYSPNGRVTKVTFTSIFHPFFLTFSIPLPLRGGKLPTKRPYCGIPGHYSLLGLPSQHGLHGLLGITKTMMSTMTTGLLTHAAIQCASLYSAAFCGRPY